MMGKKVQEGNLRPWADEGDLNEARPLSSSFYLARHISVHPLRVHYYQLCSTSIPPLH